MQRVAVNHHLQRRAGGTAQLYYYSVSLAVCSQSVSTIRQRDKRRVGRSDRLTQPGGCDDQSCDLLLYFTVQFLN